VKVINIEEAERADFFARVLAQFEPPLSQVNLDTLVPAWAGKPAYGLVSDAGEPAGFLLSFNNIDPIDGKLFAYEYLWMVGPAHRKYSSALKLFRQFESDAKLAGADTIVCGNNRVCKQDEMRKLYSFLGYQPFSESFSKKVN
jgi:hypothetical protein